VQVFASIPGGPRWPLGTVTQGGILLGATGIGAEELQATGTADLLPLPTGQMPPEAAPDLAAAAEGWVTLLAQGLGRHLGPRPVPDAVLRPGFSTVMPAGAILAAGGTGCWMALEGEASLFGLVPFAAPLPLPPVVWLSLDGAARATALDGVCWMRDAGFAGDPAAWLEALRCFTADCLDALPLIRGLAEADEANRLRLRAAQEEAQAAETGARLAAILGNPPPPPPGGADEALFLALSRVARAARLTLQRPQQRRESDLDRLPGAEDIARASNLRLRPVRLSEGWWQQDLGPLLGWHRPAGGAPAPVALLPGRRYRMVSGNGRTEPVTAALARQVAPEAQALLQPLPDAPPGLGLLARFGTGGSGGDTATMVLALVLGALLGQALPLATGLAFSVLVPAGLLDGLAQMALALAIVAGVGYALRLALEAARQRIEARSGGALQGAVWDRLLRLPVPALRRFDVGDLAARATSAVALPAGLRALAVAVAASLGLMLSSAALMLSRHPLAGLAALTWSGVGIAIALVAAWRQDRAFADGEMLEGQTESLALQFINGISKLRLAGAEDRAFRRWLDRFANMRQRGVRARAVGYLNEAWLATSPILALALAFALVAPGAAPTTAMAPMPLADVLAFLSALALQGTALQILSRSLLAGAMQWPSWKFVKPLLQARPEPAGMGADPGRLSGAVSLVNLRFAFPSRPSVLRGLSAEIAPGTFVAITGRSGSGKTTLLRLLLRLEVPDSGSISFDGQEAGSLNAALLRRQIGSVQQHGQLPSGTILDAVRGMSGASEAEIWAALGDAAIAAEIAALPMRLHTLVTDAGQTFSGGQVQRLLLARALLQRPALLLLDEATSALDASAERAVSAALEKLSITRIVVAHRLSTIRHADRILHMEDGQIAEAGTFDELVAAGGSFAKMAAALNRALEAPAEAAEVSVVDK
jgi:ABC-type bacteriocin/lantibiotic exporter with double-glycine peptidase domain